MSIATQWPKKMVRLRICCVLIKVKQMELRLEAVKRTGQTRGFGIRQILIQTPTRPITSRDFSKDSTSWSLRFLLYKMGMLQFSWEDCAMPAAEQALNKWLSRFFFALVESINTIHCYAYYTTE